ncbi:hypothetical protein ACET3Z_005376 [Daucus carota]
MEDNEDINQRLKTMGIDEEENVGFILEGEVVTDHRKDKDKSLNLNEANFMGCKTTSNMIYDLNEDDSEIIQLEDRKRRRGISNHVGHMEIDQREKFLGNQTEQQPQGTDISNGDLAVTSHNSPTELAKQASHSK